VFVLYTTHKRNSYGLNQTELAAVTGLHQSTISMIETGRLRPTRDQLQRLADALRVYPPEKLLEHVVVLREAR
jgi:transcriptional regulator with XRE-family HTH domain